MAQESRTEIELRINLMRALQSGAYDTNIGDGADNTEEVWHRKAFREFIIVANLMGENSSGVVAVLKALRAMGYAGSASEMAETFLRERFEIPAEFHAEHMFDQADRDLLDEVRKGEGPGGQNPRADER
jgi:hypothetical protein